MKKYLLGGWRLLRDPLATSGGATPERLQQSETTYQNK